MGLYGLRDGRITCKQDCKRNDETVPKKLPVVDPRLENLNVLTTILGVNGLDEVLT